MLLAGDDDAEVGFSEIVMKVTATAVYVVWMLGGEWLVDCRLNILAALMVVLTDGGYGGRYLWLMMMVSFAGSK